MRVMNGPRNGEAGCGSKCGGFAMVSGTLSGADKSSRKEGRELGPAMWVREWYAISGGDRYWCDGR